MHLNSKHVDGMIQVEMEVQGRNQNLQIIGEGPTLYEALGNCLARLAEQQRISTDNDLHLTWARSKAHPEELTVIQETKDGEHVSKRWGSNLFADLFAPVYDYLTKL